MEANINRAISYLQGQTIRGNIGNTGVWMWKGEMLFFAPAIDEHAEIGLEYSVQYSESGGEEDFLRITIVARD